MPTRSLDRSLRDAEGVSADRFSNVGKGTLHILQLALDDAELVHVLDEPLRARVAADDSRPAFADRHLAPRTAGRTRQTHVDERPLAADRTPVADGVLVGRARVAQPGDRVEAAEAARLRLPLPLERAQRRADRARLARVRMDDDLGVRHFLADEVDLRLDDREVAMRPALQDELAADRREVLQLPR